MPKRKGAEDEAAADPDKLVRQSAGVYHSADGRFQVQQSDATWFVVDTQQTNELGQELIHGPFASLKQARAAMPGARDVTPLPRTRPRPAEPTPKRKPPPPTWIDRLPESEQTKVRRLIRALEEQGVADAEALVRRDFQAGVPAMVTRLIEARLAAVVDELAGDGREAERAAEIIRRVVEILTAEGSTVRAPLPGWLLIETGREPDPPNRRIRLGD